MSTVGNVPQVDTATAKRTFAAVHAAINQGLIRACHDLSEGGLAVAIAEMAFAGGCGARIRLADVPQAGMEALNGVDWNASLLFAESASRFIAEISPASRVAFETAFQAAGVPFACIGEVAPTNRLEIAWALRDDDPTPSALLISVPLAELKEAWQKPLRW